MKTAKLYVIRENKKIYFSWNHSQTYRRFSLYCICVGFRSAIINHSQTYKCFSLSCICFRGFRSAIVCLADVTMRKLKIHETFLAPPLLPQNGYRHGKAFLTLKGYRNEQKLWYLKGKRHFALRRASIWIRQSWTLETSIN